MPNNAYLHANLGIVLSGVQRLTKQDRAAVDEFREAVDINPGDPWLRCLLAESLRDTGQASDTDEAHQQERFGRMLDPARWDDYQKNIHSVWPAVVSHRAQIKTGAGKKS
jgi:predicted Zn-dependent protease